MTFTVFYFSKMIYHSEEEGDLDMFVLIFCHPSHSSSFFLFLKLSKPRVVVVGGELHWLTPLGKSMFQFFSGSGLVLF